MTPHLSRLASQLSWAKRIFILSACVTVFALTLSVVLGTSYFFSKKNSFQNQRAQIVKVKKIDFLLEQTHALKTEISLTSINNLTPTALEALLLDRLSRWQNILAAGVEAELSLAGMTPSLILNNAAEWDKSIQHLEKTRQTLLVELDESIASVDRTHRELIIVGAIVLFFGFVIPFVILRFVVNAVRVLKTELERSAYDFLKAWSEEKARLGEEAFKNMDFWLRLLLVAGHHSGRLSSHPMNQMVGEVAYIVQNELVRLEKERQDKAA